MSHRLSRYIVLKHILVSVRGTKDIDFPYICLWHTTHNQSVWFVNSLHPLQTLSLQARHEVPRFRIRPKSIRQRAHERLESKIIGRSSEFPPLTLSLRLLSLFSSARKNLFWLTRLVCVNGFFLKKKIFFSLFWFVC